MNTLQLKNIPSAKTFIAGLEATLPANIVIQLKSDAMRPEVIGTKGKKLLPNYKAILKQSGCPYCGDTDNGVTFDDVPRKDGKENEWVFCHVCSTSFSHLDGRLRPARRQHAAKTGAKRQVQQHSSINRPCKRVWHIADSMPNAKRSEVIAACEKEGIAFYTARTQYQQWLACKKEMAERETKQAKK